MEEFKHCDGNRLEELERLQTVDRQNTLLSDELLAKQQRLTELEFTVTRLEKTAKEESDETIDSLTKKCEHLQQEKVALEEKVEKMEVFASRLSADNAECTDQLKLLREELDQARKEINELRIQSSMRLKEEGSATFSEFVKLRRALTRAEEENEMLRRKLKPVLNAGQFRVLPDIQTLDLAASSVHRKQVVRSRFPIKN